MAKSDEILKKLISLCKDMEYTKKRLDKINGCLASYPVYEKQVDDNTNALKIILPAVTHLKIKFYGIAAAIGVISGFAGMLIGKFL